LKNLIAVPDKYDWVHGISEKPINPFIPDAETLENIFVDLVVHTKSIQRNTHIHSIIYYSL
jgi:hypothetical protein